MLGKNGRLPALPLLMYLNVHSATVLGNLPFFLKPSEYWNGFTRRLKYAVLLSMTLPVIAPANAFEAMEEGNPFGVAPVADEELAEVRGTFIPIGGLLIDFALSNETIINGQTVSGITLSSAELASAELENLHRFIQIGENNKFESVAEILNSAGLVTVIQNSLDETVIQNLSQLDVTVQNFNEYQNNVPLTNALLQPSVIGLR